jgi:hypothetical protein
MGKSCMKYDYVKDSNKKRLIYVGRKPSPQNPGIHVSPEVLQNLYKRDYLTGEALLDAIRA